MKDPIARRFFVVAAQCSMLFVAGISAIVSSITCGSPAEPYVPITITVMVSLGFVAIALQNHIARFVRRAVLSNAIVFLMTLAIIGVAGTVASIARSVEVISAMKAPHGPQDEHAAPAPPPDIAPVPARAPQADVGGHGRIYGASPTSQGK